ncbi:MAG: hypothetical protein WCV59_05470 [Parcubacteria group bacterium]
MMDIIVEARSFFLDFRKDYEELLRDYPDRSKVRWYHKLFRIRPRGDLYKEAVSVCDNGLKALNDSEISEAISELDKLIQWYEWEVERFSDSIVEMGRNLEIKETIRYMYSLRNKLTDLNNKMKGKRK